MITRKNAVWWALAVVFLVLVLPVFGKILTVVVALGAYLVSLQVHPHRDCRKCGGTGFHKGWLFGSAHRRCTACGGQSRHRRAGNVILSPSRPTRAEVRAEAAGRRRNRPLP